RKDIHAGLGPVFNAASCVDCHQNPVTGGPSQITEMRVGHKDADGNFVNPTVLINDGQDTILSGHPKTGQRWSGQNRPTEEAGD
ncbi:MAG: hypothetical protein WAR24_08660, partial [Candidatus Acidiferrales bacterium]